MSLQSAGHLRPVYFQIHVSVVGSIHTCDLLNYYDRVVDCVNHFLHCNHNSWTNRKCEYTHLVQSNPSLYNGNS